MHIFVQGNKIEIKEIPFKINLKPLNYSLQHPREFLLEYTNLSNVQIQNMEKEYPGILQQIVNIVYDKNSLNNPHTFEQALSDFEGYYNRVAWIFVKHLYSTGKYKLEDLMNKTEKEIFFLNIVAIQNEEIYFSDQEKFNTYKDLLESLYPKETVQEFLKIANPRIGNFHFNDSAEKIDEANLKELQSLV